MTQATEDTHRAAIEAHIHARTPEERIAAITRLRNAGIVSPDFAAAELLALREAE